MDTLGRVWDVVSDAFSGMSQSIERGITSIFGSSNARYLKKLQSKIQAINDLEPKYVKMSDEELREQTFKFRKRLAAGETLDDLLVEAFAVCREGSKRVLGMRHYDVQLIGGAVLHSGSIAEMITGEGKTLVATLPAYLNALSGKGVHVVTVNDYLARRDMEWMGPLYMSLGLTVASIQSHISVDERQAAYMCDITYATNNELGFDYLRDNMRPAMKGDWRYPKELQQSQGTLNYAIIDEVDNILIDEARTPLIISGPAHGDITKYKKADMIARQLKKDEDFEVNEKEHTTNLTDEGIRHAEKLAGVECFYTAGNMEWPHLIDNALKAHHLYKRDVNYVINDGEIIIVDEFTGRLMPGRNWSDGLHQAVEAKENVEIKQENQTLATVTLQNFFKLYPKICGMTGTAMTEANEFWKIYKLDVIAIPPNREMKRINHPDLIFKSEHEKDEALVNEIERVNRWDILELTDKDDREWLGQLVSEHDDYIEFIFKGTKDVERINRSRIHSLQKSGRPILVGTTSIERSEKISELLDRRGVKHNVLNAKNHKSEAEIIAQAGRKGMVTIATNMAGRGTDIILGGNPEAMAWSILQAKYPTRLDVPQKEWDDLIEEIEKREQMKAEGEIVRSLGGLYVCGTERHEARRIDLQLRGRCGRQGDPGSSRFFLSLEDDLMRIFAGDWVKSVLGYIGMGDGQAIESAMVTRRIEGAQKKVEERNFEIRKNLLEYDEVMDEQRKRTYGYRQAILEGVNCKNLIMDMVDQQIDIYLATYLNSNYGVEAFCAWAGGILATELNSRHYRNMNYREASRQALDEAARMCESTIMELLEENLPEDGDEDEWNWEAMAKGINTRWNIGIRERDMRKVGRETLDSYLVEHVREFIQKIDLSKGEHYLEPEHGLKAASAWIKGKFSLDFPVEDMRNKMRDLLKHELGQKVRDAYLEKEIEFPVLAGEYHFSSRDQNGARIYDRDAISIWAASRFNAEVKPEDLKNLSRNSFHQILVEHSRKSTQEGIRITKDVQQWTDDFIKKHQVDGQKDFKPEEKALEQLIEDAKTRWGILLQKDSLQGLTPELFQRRVYEAIDDRFRPEMRKMERALVLTILDNAWKEHLLTMDHLKSSVGLRGYAQVDPKVEYKREGMKTFDNMWKSIGERVTELVFRMEQLDERFVGSTWSNQQAIHEESESATRSVSQAVSGGDDNIAQQQQEAIDGTQADRRREPIRNTQPKIGPNDPCPCGSGKKYKKCCGRNF
ncbi:MAG: SEC-C metal-binding domain-containing protein [Planctomycetia bacterium]|nr:SEC-C metal-binding domain-containing protein [Planctomycetia bacterium]